MKEYQKREQEIRDRAFAECRSLTQDEQTRCVAYSRASLASIIDSLVPKMFRELRKQMKRGKLRGNYLALAKLLANKGYREAETILDLHCQRKNDLPERVSGHAKSFRGVTFKVATPLK